MYVYGGNDPHFHSGRASALLASFAASDHVDPDTRVLPLNYIRTRYMPVTVLRYLVENRGGRAGFLFSDAYHNRCLRDAPASVPDGSLVISSAQNVGDVGRTLVRDKGVKLYFYLDATLRQYWGAVVGTKGADHLRRLLESERLSFKEAAGFFVYHEGVAAALRDDYGVPRDKIAVIGRGVTIRPDHIAAVRQEGHQEPRPASDQTLTLMTVGKDAARKGVFKVIEAIDRLPEAERRRIRYVVAGPDRSALPARAFVEPLGFVTGEGRRALLTRMRRADLGVLLSEWEGLPGSVYEFLTLGTPCWMSDLPHTEALRAHPGVVSEPLPIDGARVAERLRAFLHDPAALRDLRQRAESQWDAFTWGPIVQTMSDVMGTSRR
ncbi:glycosyltransferase family 4 protein [Roseospira marina]|uniref:glycosyltransferase family 4 protein n=1 Tax=Roseospira marina TaxID=140057 RepID=UPI00147941C1|nr:glycosyltransferase family 4 protein [Roseospira marina]